MKCKRCLFLLPLSLVLLLACNAASKTVKTQISADEIYRMIEKGRNVLIQDTKVSGNLDLTLLADKVPVHPNEEKIMIRSSIAFKNCSFSGEINGYSADAAGKEKSIIFQGPVFFDLCIFEKKINLKNAVFQNSCILTGCTFNNDIIFDNTQLMSDFDLIDCKAHGTCNFQNAFYNQKSNFFKTVFDSTCLFQSGFFNAAARFNNVIFKKYSDFSLSTFNSKVSFNYAKFQGTNLFKTCSFRDLVEFNYAHFNNTVFDKSTFTLESKFNEIVIGNKLDLSGARFLSDKPFISNNTDSILKKIIQAN